MSDKIALERRYGATNYAPLPVVLARGEGVWLWDDQGRRYLDMLSAYSAVSFGYGHPRLLAALKSRPRASRSPRARSTATACRPSSRRLCEITGMDRALPMSTGAEGVETAIKCARKWAYVVKKVPDGRARDHRLRRQLPRPHHDDRRVLLRGPVPRALRPLRRRLRRRALRRRGRARGRDHAGDRRVPRGTDPGRGGHHRAARGLSHGMRAHLPRAQRAPHRRRGADRPRDARARCSPATTKA